MHYHNNIILINKNKLDDLDEFSINRAQYTYLINLADKTVIKTFNENRILYFIDDKYFVLDTEQKKILYYLQYETSFSSKLGGSFLWQSLVWRDKKAKELNTLPHKLFFEKLLPKYKTVVTDGKQTLDGQRFWDYQIACAIENNLNIYYYNTKTKFLEKISSLIEFEKAIQKYEIWGNTKLHEQKLMVITSKQL